MISKIDPITGFDYDLDATKCAVGFIASKKLDKEFLLSREMIFSGFDHEKNCDDIISWSRSEISKLYRA